MYAISNIDKEESTRQNYFMILSLPPPPPPLLVSNMSEKKRNTNKNAKKKSTIGVSKKRRTLVETEDIEDAMSFNNDEIHKLRVALLDWYDHNRRDLPWRTHNHEEQEDEEEVEKRAYGVWVSEIMLQQTRVQTVIAYFNRWMQKWPTIQHLTLASLEVFHSLFSLFHLFKKMFYFYRYVMISSWLQLTSNIIGLGIHSLGRKFGSIFLENMVESH